MAKYKLKRDSYSFKITDGAFGGSGGNAARGEANVQLIQLDGLDADCGLDTVPSVGSQFTSIDGFNTGTATTCYSNIVLDSVQEEFFHTNEDCKIWTLSYTSNENKDTDWLNFGAQFQVISVQNPVLWKSAECINPACEVLPTGVPQPLGGEVDGRITRKVLQGSVDLQKAVHPDRVDQFWADYRCVAGKLNTRELFVLGNSGCDAITLNRGQGLVGAISNGDLTGGTYTFNVTFEFRIINQDSAAGNCICRDDWNYVFTNTNDNGAGWVVPTHTQASDGCTLVSEPFIYAYSGLQGGGDDNIGKIISCDYTQPDP